MRMLMILTVCCLLVPLPRDVSPYVCVPKAWARSMRGTTSMGGDDHFNYAVTLDSIYVTSVSAVAIYHLDTLLTKDTSGTYTGDTIYLDSQNDFPHEPKP